MGNGFDQYAPAYDAWFLKNRNVLYSEVNLLASVLENAGRVLSVGCGSGLFEKILRDERGIDIRNGIEPSEGMADIARKRGMNVAVAKAEDADETNSCLIEIIVLRDCLDRNGVVANICISKRRTEIDHIFIDEELYAERYSVERTNAWMDSYRTLLNRFDTTVSSWESWNYLAFAVLLLKKISRKRKV